MGRPPIRTLHVFRTFLGGGVEIGLLRLLRHIDREHIKFDFCTLWPLPANSASFCEEIRVLGARILPCHFLPNSATFPFRYRRILRTGQYDVVECHSGWTAGVVLRQASLEGVPVRVANCHDSSDLKLSTPWRIAWRATMKAWIQKYMTAGLAVSAGAAEYMFGPRWRSDPRLRLFYPGMDLEPFRADPLRDETRRELGIPVEAPVVGHVGRFIWKKKHAFLLEVAQEVLKSRPEVRFLLVGDGPLRPHIEAMARELGIEKSVILTGARPDTEIPRLMLSAMDVFAFPSFEEGLGRVLVEAQAAGLRALASDAVPSEASVVPGAVEYLSLSCGAKHWAERLLRMIESGRVERSMALRAVEQSDFNIQQSCRELTRMYELCLATRRG
jgi:glycosyltransferase involved in cell wall biosynthesis